MLLNLPTQTLNVYVICNYVTKTSTNVDERLAKFLTSLQFTILELKQNFFIKSEIKMAANR